MRHTFSDGARSQGSLLAAELSSRLAAGAETRPWLCCQKRSRPPICWIFRVSDQPYHITPQAFLLGLAGLRDAGRSNFETMIMIS